MTGDVIVNSGGIVSTTNVTVEQLVPAPLVEQTVMEWVPSASPVKVAGELQAAAVALSRRQVTEVGENPSVKVTDTVELETYEFCAGEVIVVAGGGLVKKVTELQPTFPAASVAQTVIVWVPTASPENGVPELHAAAAAPSTEHVVPTTEVVASAAVNASVNGRPTCWPFSGEAIVTTGGIVSTVNVTVAHAVPAAVVEQTVTVWEPWLRPL